MLPRALSLSLKKATTKEDRTDPPRTPSASGAHWAEPAIGGGARHVHGVLDFRQPTVRRGLTDPVDSNRRSTFRNRSLQLRQSALTMSDHPARRTKNCRYPNTRSERIQLAFVDSSGHRRVSSIRVQPHVRREWDAMFAEYRQLLPGKSRARVLEIIFAEMERMPFWRRFRDVLDRNARPAPKGRPPKHFVSPAGIESARPAWIPSNTPDIAATIRDGPGRLPTWLSEEPSPERTRQRRTR
jgi:hypothetical protein